ncbi:MAG: hypothetical protein CW341_02655, partial [Bacteroidetes bacterium]|nr:hypothetical protein [Bacteroidota bacterium]
NIGGYRYFFNGQEGDNEVFGEVANFGYEFRQYDSRLARWWSVDPKWSEYPSVSPYVFCNGSPIALKDPRGADILPSEAFINSSYYGVFQNLIKTNSTYQKLISDYKDGSNNFHLDYSPFASKIAGKNHMEIKKENDKIIIANAYSMYFRPNGLDQSEIAQVKTLLHEAVHAYDGFYGRKTPNHTGFDRISVMEGLKEYNKTYNLGYTEEDLEILSWSGLQESEEFGKYIEDRTKTSGRSFKAEQEFIEERITFLMYEPSPNSNMNKDD